VFRCVNIQVITVADYCYKYLAKQHVSALLDYHQAYKDSGVSQGTFNGVYLWDPMVYFLFLYENLISYLIRII